jgi:putative PEP-CTERM system TPR-repeat lipoprotein
VRYRFIAIVWLAALLLSRAQGVAATNYVADAESLLAKGQMRAAEIQLKNAVRSDPSDMLAHYRLAVVQLQLGEAAAAEHEAQAARAGGYDPDHTVPLLAQTYLAQQKYGQLLQDFPGTEGSAVERSGVLVARGYAQIALRNTEEAHKSFKEAQEIAPSAAPPLLAEAKLLMAERQFATAEPLVDQALQIDGKSNEARLAKVQLLRIKGDPDQALSKLNELLADAPGYVPARLARAEILISQDKPQPAKADIDAVLAAQPGSVAGIYLDAVLAAKAKQFDKANADLQKISGSLASIPRGYYLQALVQYQLKHLDQAEDAAKRYATRNPDDLAGQKLLGALELELRRPADTIDALSKFETAGKADAQALDLLGRAYIQVGKTGEALAAFSAAVKLAPESAALHTRLGQAQLRAGHRSEGVTDLEESLNLGPSAPAAEMLVITELAAGEWQRAIDAANKLQQAQPDSPVPGNLLGLTKLAQFDLDGAGAQFADIAKKHPDFLPARLNLARALELQGKAEEAEKVLNQVLTEQPTNSIALGRLVDLLLRDGKADAAVAAAERAHSAAHTNQGITVGLIDLYLRHGDKDKALALAREEARTANGGNVALIAARARAEFAAGQKKDAADSYRRLIDINPSQIAYRRQLAALLISNDDLEGAQQEIDKAMEVAPNNPQLAEDRIAIALKTPAGVAGAVAIANQLKATHPGLPTAPALEGDAYMAAKEYEKAAAAYSKAFQQSPSAMLAVRLATAKSLGGNADAGTQVLREWSAKHQDDIGVTAQLGTADLAAHRDDEAKKELEQVLGKAPQDPIVLNNLAWLYQQSGDQRARSVAERAYLLAPNLPQTADTLGWILVKEGKPAAALGLLKEAGGTPSASPSIRYHLAVALNDVGEHAQALQLLHELTSGPTSFDEKPAAQKLLAELSKG